MRTLTLRLNRYQQPSYCGLHYSIDDDAAGHGFLVAGCGGPYRDAGAVRYSDVPAVKRERIRRRMDELLHRREITGAEYNDFFDRDGVTA